MPTRTAKPRMPQTTLDDVVRVVAQLIAKQEALIARIEGMMSIVEGVDRRYDDLLAKYHKLVERQMVPPQTPNVAPQLIQKVDTQKPYDPFEDLGLSDPQGLGEEAVFFDTGYREEKVADVGSTSKVEE